MGIGERDFPLTDGIEYHVVRSPKNVPVYFGRVDQGKVTAERADEVCESFGGNMAGYTTQIETFFGGKGRSTVSTAAEQEAELMRIDDDGPLGHVGPCGRVG